MNTGRWLDDLKASRAKDASRSRPDPRTTAYIRTMAESLPPLSPDRAQRIALLLGLHKRAARHD